VAAPITTAGIDGHFVGGTPGVYYDVAAFNGSGALNPVASSNVHWLVPYGPANQFLHQEIGRNSFANPAFNSTTWRWKRELGCRTSTWNAVN
jgi:hypothetical protein